MTSTTECFWGNRCQGNCEGRRSPRRDPVTQVDGYPEVLFTCARETMCACVCVLMHTWVYADYCVIACNDVLGGGTRRYQCEPPYANEWAHFKAGQGTGLYTGSVHSFVKRYIIADKPTTSSSPLICFFYRRTNTVTGIYKRHVTPLMWCCFLNTYQKMLDIFLKACDSFLKVRKAKSMQISKYSLCMTAFTYLNYINFNI